MADRYWVGGTGNWSDDDNHWATTSGGTPANGNIPTSSDNVIFDTLSNAIAYTCTVDVAADCANLTLGNPLAGAITFAGSSVLNIFGNLTVAAGITRTFTGAIDFEATTTGKTLTFNGVTFASTVTFRGVGGGWTFQDAFNNGTSNINQNAGDVNTNGMTITAGNFNSSNSTTRTLTLGASTLTLTGQFTIATSTNLTFSGASSTINLTSATVTTFAGSGKTFGTVSLTCSGSSSLEMSGTNTIATLTCTGAANKTTGVRFVDSVVVTGTLTLNGNSITNRIIVSSLIRGTSITLTAATVTVTNADFRDINGAGAGSWDLSAITGLSGDCGGNTNITLTSAQDHYWVGGTGSWSATGEWSTSSGGASGARVPLPQDNCFFDNGSFSAGSQTVTADMPRLGKNIDWSGYSEAQTPTWTTSTAATIFGNLTLIADMTLTASTQTYTFEGRGSQTFTSAGKSWAKTIDFNGFGGTYTLQDTFTSTAQLGHDAGTLNTNNQTVTALSFDGSGSNTRTLTLGSSTVTLTGTGTIWNWVTTTGLTFNPNTSTIKTTDASATGKTFAGGGQTFNNVWFAVGAGTGSITVSGSNTFADLKDDGSAAHSILFTAGTTQTFTTFTISGASGALITINSTTTAVHFLKKNGGGTISRDYLSIQHSIASPAITWYAGANSTNNQGDATAGRGWTFTVAPTGVQSTFFTMFT